MQEKSILDFEINKMHPVSPTQIKKIRQLLETYPDRYTDQRNFVSTAIEIFLQWELDPLTAKKRMAEEHEPTIPQLAMIQVMSKPEQVMYPELIKKHEKEIREFLDKNPAYEAEGQKAQDAESIQSEQRRSKGDFDKVVNSMNQAREFIKNTKVIPTDDLLWSEQTLLEVQMGYDLIVEKEIKYDGWPLLWTHYSRILPAKISLLGIVDIMNEKKCGMIKLDEDCKAHIYDIAEELSEKLIEYEKEHNLKRESKLSTGLPKPFPKDKKITPSQVMIEKRYKDRFIGKTRKSKDTGIESFDGMLSALGLITVFQKDGDIYVTLTEKGHKFYLQDNPIINGDYSHGSFSEEERRFLLTEVISERKLQMKLIQAVISTLKLIEKENLSGDMTKNLDDAFETTIQEFVDNNKDDKVSQKINDDILVKTNEIEKENNNKVKKDQKQTPIQAYRIATMGRLSEIRLVKWTIDDEVQSHYEIIDDEIASDLLKMN